MKMEETIRVYDWIKANKDFVKQHRWKLDRLRHRIKQELGIRTTNAAIERIAGWKPASSSFTPMSAATSQLHQLVDAVEHLYDQLGEERHHRLVELRQTLLATDDAPIE